MMEQINHGYCIFWKGSDNVDQEMNHTLKTMNIELTTKCPLSCPQCYCSLEGGKEIPLETAIYWIREGASMGVKEVMLSGGETLCYKNLMQVVKEAADSCGSVYVSLSGVGFCQETLDALLEAGVTGIHISLNGSVKEINQITRDGYEYAISALQLLQKNKVKNVTLNWVMHRSNADDFPDLVALAESYEVNAIEIIGPKPDANYRLDTFPSREQMYRLKEFMRSYRGTCRIQIESCFSPMLALYCDTKLFGNFNTSPYLGCCAGRTTFSVTVDGQLTPCRHLDYSETFTSLRDYIANSSIQQKIRLAHTTRNEPCSRCRLREYCRPCLAINAKCKGEIFSGFNQCPVFEE